MTCARRQRSKSIDVVATVRVQVHRLGRVRLRWRTDPEKWQPRSRSHVGVETLVLGPVHVFAVLAMHANGDGGRDAADIFVPEVVPGSELLHVTVKTLRAHLVEHPLWAIFNSDCGGSMSVACTFVTAWMATEGEPSSARMEPM